MLSPVAARYLRPTQDFTVFVIGDGLPNEIRCRIDPKISAVNRAEDIAEYLLYTVEQEVRGSAAPFDQKTC